MEAIITIVGFLGSGKTTLLRHLVTSYTGLGWQPFVILNDYENANLDALQFSDAIAPRWLKALTGSCICCTGIHELRDYVNGVPKRDNGITLIEANGTSDACALMEFLGVGLKERFLPPVQLTVVDVNNWQKRGEHNDLEVNQVLVASLIVLAHIEKVTVQRQNEVVQALKILNPYAEILTLQTIDVTLLSKLVPSQNKGVQFDHQKAHWASCSCDLPSLPDVKCITYICELLPKSILRVKGCTQIEGEEGYMYFERTPDGNIFSRPFNGLPITGPKLLTIGPNSNLSVLEHAISKSLKLAKSSS